uniref:Uncharacterized protein n=1 Tax=Anguilla anguilla TaxID=7936 RepID=A0A0E9UYZ1_ANGAN
MYSSCAKSMRAHLMSHDQIYCTKGRMVKKKVLAWQLNGKSW